MPLPKNNRLPFSETNSRPISLLPILSKIMEKIAHEQIQSYFVKNGLMTYYQHAYRSKHSTATALTQMVDDWLQGMDQSHIIGAVLLDFSAAFDILNHELMLEKLKYYGFTESALFWVNSYLSNRKQMVYFNGSFSDIIPVKHGVPQGSCLGPLLYSIFTNDLPLVLTKANISMYADDSTIYLAAATVDDLNEKLASETANVVDWINKNKLILNVSKTNCIVLGTNHLLSSKPVLNIAINNTVIQQVEEVKLLGVTIDNKLSWDKHVQKVVTKMGNALSIIKRCAKYFTHTLAKQVIQALVLSNLDYCSIVWSSTSCGNIRKLQLVQNKAARVALSCSWRTNVIKMHKTLGWLNVRNRLLSLLMVFIKNVIITKSPQIIYRKLCFSSLVHTHSTRHAAGGCFTLPSSSKAMQRSVTYRAMHQWNTLPNNITQLNIHAFKMQIKNYYMNSNFE